MPNHPMLETKILTEMVRKFPTPTHWATEKLFPRVNSAAWRAEWDVFDFSRKVGTHSGRGRPGIQRAKSERNRYVTDYLHTRMTDIVLGVDMQSLLKPGASSFDEAWGEQYVADTLEDLVRQVDYLIEYDQMKMLQGGVATLTVDGVSISWGEQFKSTHRPTAAVTWATASTDIIADIMTCKALIKQDAGLVADFILVDEVAHGWLMNNTAISKFIAETSDVDSIIKEGVIARLLGLDVVVYDDVYASETGDPVDFWTTGYGLVGCYADKAKTKCLIGPVEDPEAGGSPGLFSKSWKSEDPAGTNVLVDANFAPVISIPEAFVYIDLVT